MEWQWQEIVKLAASVKEMFARAEGLYKADIILDNRLSALETRVSALENPKIGEADARQPQA